MTHFATALNRREWFAGMLGTAIVRNSLSANSEPEMSIRASRLLPPLPDREGFAGMYAGVVGGKLVAAGGANFPNGYPWEGGRKVWYDDLFVLESPESDRWTRLPGLLPAPAGYGVSISWNDRTYLIGGETGPAKNAQGRITRCLADVISLGLNEGKFEIRTEPPLPEPIKDACGVLIGSQCYVFGGLQSASSGEASGRLYVLDLSEVDRGWRRCSDLPGEGRFQAIAGSDGKDLIVYSGIVAEIGPDGSQIRRKPYLREVWRFAPGPSSAPGQWTRLKDMPREAAAAPSPAIRTGPGELAILSGAMAADHAKLPEQHPGWGRDVLLHDPQGDRWRIVRTALSPGMSVVTAPTVFWRGGNHVISGEVSPGRRTPAITTIEFEMQDQDVIRKSR